MGSGWHFPLFGHISLLFATWKVSRAGSCWPLRWDAEAGAGAPDPPSSKLCDLQPVPSPLCASKSSFIKRARELAELVSSTPTVPMGPRLEIHGG